MNIETSKTVVITGVDAFSGANMEITRQIKTDKLSELNKIVLGKTTMRVFENHINFQLVIHAYKVQD